MKSLTQQRYESIVEFEKEYGIFIYKHIKKIYIYIAINEIERINDTIKFHKSLNYTDNLSLIGQQEQLDIDLNYWQQQLNKLTEE